MPFCSNCGAAVPPSARFCSGCGQATAAGAAPAPSSSASSYSPSSSSNVSSITGVAQQGASVSNAYATLSSFLLHLRVEPPSPSFFAGT